MAINYGVFLARMQPVHNAHLHMINEALKESDKVLVVLGSENKEGMLRNPYDIKLREQMLRECLTPEQNERLDIGTLPDWSMESDTENADIWGRYFYYNVVSRIGQKHFSLYYSDGKENLDSWFKDTEVYPYVEYRLFERSNLFDGLSATKIRQAFMNGDIEYVKQFCPESVTKRFHQLAECYKDVVDNPKEDFSMDEEDFPHLTNQYSYTPIITI